MTGPGTVRPRWLRLGLVAAWIGGPVLLVATMVYFAIVGNPALFWLSDWVDRTLLPHKWLVLSLWTAPFVVGLHAVSRRELRLWRQAAADLGLEVPRVEGRLQWAMLLLWPTSKQVYDLLPPMQGEMRGVRVRVAAETALTREHEGNSIRTVKTVVTASLTRHPDVALDVTETGIVSLDDLRERVGLPPEDAHETGDAAFDDRFDVRLSTPADVKPSWVLSSGVREALLAVDHLTELTVADGEVTLRLEARVFDPATLERLTGAATELATAIDRIAETDT